MNTVFSLHQLPQVATDLIRSAQNETIWLFHGEMGTGKTTLIKELCKQLGATEDLSSPTFSIVNEYNTGRGAIYHFDLYRLKNERELQDIGFEEYLDSGNYCFIEWPQKAMPFLPGKFLELYIETVDPSQRRIQVVTIP